MRRDPLIGDVCEQVEKQMFVQSLGAVSSLNRIFEGYLMVSERGLKKFWSESIQNLTSNDEKNSISTFQTSTRVFKDVDYPI